MIYWQTELKEKNMNEIEFEREGEAPENWQENLKILAEEMGNCEILTAEDMNLRINTI